jgi:hypothetical protein
MQGLRGQQGEQQEQAECVKEIVATTRAATYRRQQLLWRWATQVAVAAVAGGGEQSTKCRQSEEEIAVMMAERRHHCTGGGQWMMQQELRWWGVAAANGVAAAAALADGSGWHGMTVRRRVAVADPNQLVAAGGEDRFLSLTAIYFAASLPTSSAIFAGGSNGVRWQCCWKLLQNQK